jgi:hypothetical protein
MTTTYTHIGDLAKEVQPPDKGILGRALHNDDRLKADPPAEYRDAAAPGLAGVVKHCLRP